MSRKAIAFIVVPILLVGAFLFMNFLAGKKELPPQRPKPPAINYVKVEEVAYKETPVEIEVFGRVGSSQQINVVAEVGGRLEQGSINLKEGENFNKGQILARVNNNEQRLNLQSRKANFLNLFASVIPDIKIDFPDTYDLWLDYYNKIDLNKDLPTIPEEIPSKARTFLASKSILSEYYSIRSLEENLRKYNIIAPYNGSVLSVNLETGSVVNPGAVIASIIRTDKLELKVPVQQKDMEYVSIGSEVQVVQEAEGKSWTGKVIRKADFIDPNTQSVSVYISLDNSASDVYDGLYLKAIIPGRVIDRAMEIDRSVLRNKNEVFVVADSVLLTREVNIIKVSSNRAVINGLDEGDKIVVDAPSNASNNMKVQIVE
ncbi:MAG: efflux RND transporter periplasmic adaptor subunit [Bacteroidota bacterium]